MSQRFNSSHVTRKHFISPESVAALLMIFLPGEFTLPLRMCTAQGVAKQIFQLNFQLNFHVLSGVFTSDSVGFTATYSNEGSLQVLPGLTRQGSLRRRPRSVDYQPFEQFNFMLRDVEEFDEPHT